MNILLFLFLIVYPYIQNLNLENKIGIEEKKLSENESIFKLQKDKIKDFIDLKEIERKKDLNFQKKEEELVYSSSGEFLYFILENIEKLNLSLNLMGREVYTPIGNKRDKIAVHFEISGSEKGIYKFLEMIENEEKYSTLLKQGLLIKYENNEVNLKGNFMYIIKNKGEKSKIFSTKKEMKLKKIKKLEDDSFGRGNYLRMGTRRRMI